jgi:hypothetical protein
MTDKQIIIDGVDVKDCKRRIGKDNFCRYYKRPCTENNYNCIWKKYYRKERECEELKKYQYEQEFLQEQLDKVIKKNKELKTCYKNNLTLLDKEEVNTTKLVNKVMKLEKTLAEIRNALDTYFDDDWKATREIEKIIKGQDNG